MILLMLLMYGLPVYLVFFRFKWIRLTLFWKIALWVPPLAAVLFLWFALGRYAPLTQDAYVQAPVVQIAPEVGGYVTEVYVKDDQLVKKGDPLFRIDPRSYQFDVDQAQAKVFQTQQEAAGLLASRTAAQESVRQAEAMLVSARKNIEALGADLEAARSSTTKVKAQLDLAESKAARNAVLLAKNALSQEDYEESVRTTAVRRAEYAEAQQRESKARTAIDVGESQAVAAGSAVVEARALGAKAEAMVDPAKAFESALEGRKTELEELTKKPDAPGAGERIREAKERIDLLTKGLEKAREGSPFLEGEFAAVRQAREASNAARLNLERCQVLSPTDGIVSNVQLTAGSYVKPGAPVLSLIDAGRWRLVAAVPENWLELVRPGDAATISLRNYPLRLRTAKVETVGRGVVQGQGVPSGNLPDTDPRRTRQTDTPVEGQEFQVIVALADDRPGQPLRVGATGRVTVFAGGGMPVVNELATILHCITAFLDYFHPKPSLLVLGIAAVLVVALVLYLRRKSARRTSLAASSESRTSRGGAPIGATAVTEGGPGYAGALPGQDEVKGR